MTFERQKNNQRKTPPSVVTAKMSNWEHATPLSDGHISRCALWGVDQSFLNTSVHCWEGTDFQGGDLPLASRSGFPSDKQERQHQAPPQRAQLPTTADALSLRK